MTHVGITSTGAYLPGDPLTNADLEQLVGPLPEDILEGIQVKERYWMIDPKTGDHRISNSEMATKAAQAALEAAELEPSQIELIVTSTASPDYHLPPMVTLVQEALGLQRCATTEIRSGCAGFVEALDIARMYVERGDYSNALVIGSEAISPLLVPIFRGKEPDQIRMRDRMNPYNFGDGAGAVVLQPTEGDGILGSAMASVGGDRPAGMQVIGGSTHAPLHEQQAAKLLGELKFDVVASGEVTPHVLTEALTAVLERSGLRAEDIDLCVIPEGNAGYMVVELEEAGLLTPEWIALKDKIYENLTWVGATGSAAVPLALHDAWKNGRVKAGGKLVDDVGRRRIFAFGLVIFTLASLWCALSTSGGELIAARGAQGAGAALMLPATISIIAEAFSGVERGLAFGIWAAVSGVALAIGPLVGGVIIDIAHWSWIFYINIPIGIVGLLVTFAIVPESRDTTTDQPLDFIGLVTSGGAMLGVAYGLIEANKHGWGSAPIILCFVGSALLFTAFVLFELAEERRPMFDIRLFRNRVFAGANIAGFVAMCSLPGFIFFTSLYLQNVRRFSPIHAGWGCLIATL